MSKFGNLGVSGVELPFRVTLISPETSAPIKGKDGDVAYIEVLCGDSKKAREYDRERRVVNSRRALTGSREELAEDDDHVAAVARLAHLTTGWNLIDPVTLEKIEVPCNEANALELYSASETAYIFRQAAMGSSLLRNFTSASSKSSKPSASGSSNKAEK